VIQRAGGLPPLLSLLVVVLCVAALAPAAGAADAHVLVTRPALARIAVGPAVVPDALLTGKRERTLLASATWGGQYATPDGQTVTIQVSDAYPQDQSLPQHWADFLGSLVHGPELSRLVMYLAPQDEVSQVCGPGALACYGATQSTLLASPEDPAPDFSAEAVITHEYGHHVAANRTNAPFDAIDYGTKRWSSYEQICAGAQTGRFFPGAESEPNYQLNPGEAFAETYRVLNERRAGLPEPPWQVVSQSLYPDDIALAAVQQDVLSPWTTATATTKTAKLSKRTKSHTFTLATPLDGELNASVRGPAHSRTSIVVLQGAKQLTRASGGSRVTASVTICGPRTVKIRVARTAGAGTFRLVVAKP